MGTTLIHSGTLVCMDAAHTVARADLLVDGERIAAIGDAIPAALGARPPDQRIDATGCLVIPGLVHGHLHLCQTLFRGRAEQADLLRWLRESIWPLEAAHTAASIAASARLGLAELIAGGVTCINDMGTVRHTEAIGEVLEESGIRATFGMALMDRGEGVPPALLETRDRALDDALALAKRFHGGAGGRLRVALAPRFILSCSENLWRNVRDAARERELCIHTHLAESPEEGREVEAAVGVSAARFFDANEVLSARFIGAHGVWLEADERAAIAGAGAALVHCPGSNLKLGSGFARVRSWIEDGIRCGLGSDGAACNNRLDTFHELSLASGLSRTLDRGRGLTDLEAFSLATSRGAAALGLAATTGSLEPGKQADLALVDVSGPHLAPRAEAEPYTTLVHAARVTDVRLTLVAGRTLYRNGEHLTLDAARISSDAGAEARGLLRRAEGVA